MSVWIALAASTTSVPFGTRTSTPSIVTVTKSVCGTVADTLARSPVRVDEDQSARHQGERDGEHGDDHGAADAAAGHHRGGEVDRGRECDEDRHEHLFAAR